MIRCIKFLQNIAIVCLLVLQFATSALARFYNPECANPDSDDTLIFVKGKNKCAKYINRFAISESEHIHFNSLKEFKINPSNKYCLWGSENWDQECQDAALKYAYYHYSEDWQKFSELIIKFIEHIQNRQYDQALALVHDEAVFFTHDEKESIVTNQSDLSKKICGYRAYIKNSSEAQNPDTPIQERQFGDFNMEPFRQQMMSIDTKNLKFFLADISKIYAYGLVIPYKDKNLTKYFVVGFDAVRGLRGRREYYCSLYELGIYSSLPDQLN